MTGVQVLTGPEFPYLEPHERSFSICREGQVFRQSRVFASDGACLTVFEAGAQDNPTVLLINALGMSCLFLAPLAKRLSRRYHVVTWETRGLPDYAAAIGELDLSVARHVGDAVQILSSIGVTPEAILAYCSGSNVAIHALSDEAIQARRVCLVSPSILLPQVEQKTDYQRTMLPIWKKVTEGGRKTAAMVRSIIQQSRPEFEGALEAELFALNNLPFKTDDTTLRYARLQTGCQSIDWTDRLAQVRCPGLVFHGENDDIIHVASSSAVAALLERADFEVVPDAGHFAVFGSATLHERVAAFLADIEASVADTNLTP